MRITTRTWNNYIARLSRLNEAAGQKMREYIRLHGTDDTEALISYAYAVITRYGEGSAELACQSTTALAEAEGVLLPAAEPAATASYGEVARMVHATKDQNPENLPSGVSRLVKHAGADHHPAQRGAGRCRVGVGASRGYLPLLHHAGLPWLADRQPEVAEEWARRSTSIPTATVSLRCGSIPAQAWQATTRRNISGSTGQRAAM